jgi:hypothetical protein
MKASEKLMTVFAVTLLTAGAAIASGGGARYRQVDAECPAADGKPALSLHYDNVRSYPTASGTVLVTKHHAEVKLPKSCVLTLKR